MRYIQLLFEKTKIRIDCILTEDGERVDKMKREIERLMRLSQNRY